MKRQNENEPSPDGEEVYVLNPKDKTEVISNRIVEELANLKKNPDFELNPSTIEALQRQGINLNNLDLSSISDLETLSYETMMNQLQFAQNGLVCAVGCSVVGTVGVGTVALAVGRFLIGECAHSLIGGNATITFPNEDPSGYTIVSKTAKVVCEDGYTQTALFDGSGTFYYEDQELVCETPNVWSPSTVIDCVGRGCYKSIKLTVQEGSTDVVSYDEVDTSTELTPIEGSATVSCSGNTILNDVVNDQYLASPHNPVCIDDRKWNSSIYECIPTCANVDLLPNIDDSWKTFNEFGSESLRTPVGENATLKCNDEKSILHKTTFQTLCFLLSTVSFIEELSKVSGNAMALLSYPYNAHVVGEEIVCSFAIVDMDQQENPFTYGKNKAGVPTCEQLLSRFDNLSSCLPYEYNDELTDEDMFDRMIRGTSGLLPNTVYWRNVYLIDGVWTRYKQDNVTVVKTYDFNDAADLALWGGDVPDTSSNYVCAWMIYNPFVKKFFYRPLTQYECDNYDAFYPCTITFPDIDRALFNL